MPGERPVDAREPALGILEINEVWQVVHQRLQQIALMGQRLLGLFARGDVVKDGDKIPPLLAVSTDGKPNAQRAEMRFKPFRRSGLRHPAVDFQQFRVGLVNARNDFADFFSADVFQTGQFFKSRIDVEVGEIQRAVAVKNHLTAGKSLRHVLKQGMKPRLAFPQNLFRLLAGGDVQLDGDEILNFPVRAAHRRDRHLLKRQTAVLALVDQFAVPDIAGGEGGPQVGVKFGRMLAGFQQRAGFGPRLPRQL